MSVNAPLKEDVFWWVSDKSAITPNNTRIIDEIVAHSKQKRALRERFSERVFWFTVAWAGFLAAVLVAEAYSWRLFHLDYRIIVALIAGTSAGIIGLLAAVVKYIFPEK